MNTTKLIYIFVAIAVVAGLLSLFSADAPTPPDNEGGDLVACTMDAKECPDGSYVGRVGPECEFAACPATDSSSNDQPAKDLSDMIQVATPQANAVVTSPLQLSGEATGPWFFEASAPVEVRDDQGTVLAEGFVTAEGDWMVTNFVSFAGTISFAVPAGVTEGSVVFKKDNPSGLAEHDATLVVPVQFAQ